MGYIKRKAYASSTAVLTGGEKINEACVRCLGA